MENDADLINMSIDADVKWHIMETVDAAGKTLASLFNDAVVNGNIAGVTDRVLSVDRQA